MMKNYLSKLRNQQACGWNGFHNEQPNMSACHDGIVDFFCPVQTNNITDNTETVEVIYKVHECVKDDVQEVKALLQSMIKAVSNKYAKVAQIMQKPEINDISAVYTGNGTIRLVINVTTPVLKNGEYLINDMLTRYYGNIPEHPGTVCVHYEIKSVA